MQESYAQIGPGGVGNSSTNSVWFKAGTNFSTTTNNNPLYSWAGSSGNGHTASQATNNKRPLVKNNATNNINNNPTIKFDGFNDILEIPNHALINLAGPYYERTFDFAIRTGNNISARQVIYEEGGRNKGFNVYIDNGKLYIAAYSGSPNWGYKYISTNISANTAYNVTVNFDANNDKLEVFINGQSVGAVSGIGQLNAHSGEIAFGAINGRTVFHDDNLNVGTYFPLYEYSGEIIEWISYKNVLNTAQQKIVENYLSAKFDIALATNNIYFGDDNSNGDYDIEVAGIGRDDINNIHSEASSAGMTMSINSNFTDGDFLLYGHKTKSNSINSSDIYANGASLVDRWERIWYYDKTTSNNLYTDIEFNFSDAGLSVTPDLSLDYVLIYRASDSDLWTVVDDNASIVDDVVSFANVEILNDGYYTLASKLPHSLPIELISFTANLDIENNVELSWATASEFNNDYFIIERGNSINEFEVIAKIAGAGNSNSIIEYSYIDTKALTGRNYYRISQVDFDGTTSSFEIISIEKEQVSMLKIYPTVVTENATLNICNIDNESYNIKIINTKGAILYDNCLFENKLKLPYLNRGIYYLLIEQNNMIQKEKIVVR